MIIVAVDDLMLASRIRQAAGRRGIELHFPRSAAEVVERARLGRAAMIILDLQSSRFDPLATLAALKADPVARSIPALGFVSHVQADLIAAARQAGAERVLARSAFFEKLADILEETRVVPHASPEIGLRDVTRAHERILPYVRRTPLVESEWLSSVTGADVRLKLESLQVTHSFKPRGMANAALALVDRTSAGEKPPMLVTASAGNAGRALAWAAERAGLRPIVFTPRDAPRVKLDAIRRHGADLRAEADNYDDAERRAKQYAAAHGLLFISPFSHPDLIAGFGTIALEVVEEFPGIDTYVVPVGGGGLISGIGLAAKALSRAVRVVGIEVEASHPFAVSLREGRITEIVVRPSIADGLVGNLDPETITFELARHYVDEWAQVSEDDLKAGIRGLVTEEHLIAEGAGIAGVAAALAKRVDLKGRRVAIVVSGANIDLDRLRAVLA